MKSLRSREEQNPAASFPRCTFSPQGPHVPTSQRPGHTRAAARSKTSWAKRREKFSRETFEGQRSARYRVDGAPLAAGRGQVAALATTIQQTSPLTAAERHPQHRLLQEPEAREPGHAAM